LDVRQLDARVGVPQRLEPVQVAHGTPYIAMGPVTGRGARSRRLAGRHDGAVFTCRRGCYCLPPRGAAYSRGWARRPGAPQAGRLGAAAQLRCGSTHRADTLNSRNSSCGGLRPQHGRWVNAHGRRGALCSPRGVACCGETQRGDTDDVLSDYHGHPDLSSKHRLELTAKPAVRRRLVARTLHALFVVHILAHS
jgi:hypothetical protein